MEFNKVKIILISQFPLPYSGIGSWTTMYNYYLSQKNNKIDIVISPPTENKIESLLYYEIRNSRLTKIQSKLTSNNYLQIFKLLNKIIQPSEKYIIQIIDNQGLVVPLGKYLLNKQVRKQCYLQFFYHGFPPFYENFQSRLFYENLDEHIVLTLDSYKEHQKEYTILPCAFNVLHNGIDCKQFYALSYQKKLNLRATFKIPQSKLIFIWCSQDRPKKGLDFILKVWRSLVQKHPNIELWVIGSNRKIEAKQVRNIGRIPNKEIARYYQLADFYLYPSLCHEGFGLTLAEALKCGCYCIASNNGGIPEVLNYGNYGKLIERPNFIKDWVEEIEKSIGDYIKNDCKNPYIDNLPENLYNLDIWSNNMNTIIDDAKALLS